MQSHPDKKNNMLAVFEQLMYFITLATPSSQPKIITGRSLNITHYNPYLVNAHQFRPRKYISLLGSKRHVSQI